MRRRASVFAGRAASSASASSAGDQPGVGEERHQAERLPSRQLRDARHAVGKQRWIAAKLVDDEAADQRFVLGRDHGLGTDEARNDAAAIDIADRAPPARPRAGKTHIGNVVGAQIDFGGAAGAFDQHDIGLGLHACITVEHDGSRSRFIS